MSLAKIIVYFCSSISHFTKNVSQKVNDIQKLDNIFVHLKMFALRCFESILGPFFYYST